MNLIKIVVSVLIALSVLSGIGGCARVGNDFDTQRVYEIKIGETTQEDIAGMFGQPWRKGIENGVVTWTYGRYTYRLIGETDTKDLVIKFDHDRRVRSYNFSTTDK